ncbi:MAG: insulinase family protein [Ignavibacteriales bacterium]|nr:insulinase family protein [Ignavibacteriales bacterium]
MLEEGAGEWSALELNALLESRGLSLSASAQTDYLSVTIQGLSGDIDLMMKILSEVVYQPHFNLEDFERKIDRVRNNIKQAKNDPQSMAWFLFGLVMQGKRNGYTYQSATEESVENITLSDVTFFHAEHIEPIKPVFNVVSDLPYKEIESSIIYNFKSIPGIHDPEPVDTEFVYKDLRIFILDRKGSSQTEIAAGVPLPRMSNSLDDAAVLVVNNLYGGHFNSRLNKNLREEKGFTYGISSFMRPLKDSTQYIIMTSVDTGNTGPALIEILKELNDVRKNISNEELDFSKQFLIKGAPFKFETYHFVSMLMQSIVSRGLPLDYYSEQPIQFSKVDIENAITAANQYLLLENLQIVLVGDFEEILKTIPAPLLRGVVEINDSGKVIVREQDL